METSELYYDLPQELIAKRPASPRDAARLMVLDRGTTDITDSKFLNLPGFLNPGDLLVFNETRVFPARVFAERKGKKSLEILFLEEKSAGLWHTMVRGKVLDGENIKVSKNLYGQIYKKGEGVYLSVNLKKEEVFRELERIGEVPLPPYIKRAPQNSDKRNYQSIFAKNTGSAAAPTASLHFTKRLIDKLVFSGVNIGFLDLTVGLGTFAPIKSFKVESHPIHSEYFAVKNDLVEKIIETKKRNNRVVAVGTTVCRALESAAKTGNILPSFGETNLFIYPGYKFQVIDALLTNFHTPKSSLLALVWAFYGKDKTQRAYRHAINESYRFFSYGDGMLIL